MYIWKAFLTAKITVVSLFCQKAGLYSKKRLIANYPTTDKRIDRKETENEEGDVKDVLDEVDEP